MDPLLLAGLVLLLVASGKAKPGVKMTDAGGQAPSGAQLPPIGPTTGQQVENPFHSAGSPGDSTYPLPAMVPDVSTQANYLKQLYFQEATHKQAIRDAYSVPRLRAIATAAGAYHGVPPSWVYGMMQGESNFYPVGVYGGQSGSADKAIKARSSAYGMGQILRGRWIQSSEDGFRSKYHGAQYPHWRLLDPKVAIWGIAASLGRMVRNRGGGVLRPMVDQVAGVRRAARGVQSPDHQGSLAVGHWWAGQTEGARKGARSKVRQILVYGPQVYDDSTRKPSSSWQKTSPPAQPADYLPPWRTGQLSSQQYADMLVLASVLETAGNELRDLNPDLTT